MQAPKYKHRLPAGRAILAAESAGDGPPVIFLHANVADSRMWDHQIGAISETHRAIAYDRRGFGETSASPEDFSSLSDLFTVLDELANDAPVFLVGCSRGGLISLDAALLRPNRVAGLVLIAPSVSGAPAPEYPPAIQRLMMDQNAAEMSGDLNHLNDVQARLWLDGPLAPEGRVGDPARALFLDMNGIALRSPPFGSDIYSGFAYENLEDIKAPTLLISGELDFPHILKRSAIIAKRMPNCDLHPLPHAAHLPSLECPEEISGLICSFITSLVA